MARQNYMNRVTSGGVNQYWKNAGKWAAPSAAAGTNSKFATNADMKVFMDGLGAGNTVRQVKTFVI